MALSWSSPLELAPRQVGRATLHVRHVVYSDLIYSILLNSGIRHFPAIKRAKSSLRICASLAFICPFDPGKAILISSSVERAKV
jgi:hypothetical protein